MASTFSELPAESCAKRSPSVVVGWFRNDLRLRDNPMLEKLVSTAVSRGLPVLLVYIFDRRFYDRSPYGRVTDPAFKKSIWSRQPVEFSSRKCNGRRARFYLNVLRDLRGSLSDIGLDLHVLTGKPEEVFAALSEQYGPLDVVCLREPVSPEWTDVEDMTDAALSKHGGSLTRLWGAMSLYHEEDLPFSFDNVPGSYTELSWSLGWENIWTGTAARQELDVVHIRKPVATPMGPLHMQVPATPRAAWVEATLEDDREALALLGFTAEEVEATLKSAHGGSRKGKGGETAAWTRFQAWMQRDPEPEGQASFADWDLPTSGTQYDAEVVDGLQWKNLSRPHGWMQMSKYLACGCISPREIYHTLVEKGHWALPGVVHRLVWREFHRLNAIMHHRKLFWLQGPYWQNHVWRPDPELANRWKTGETGIPYIDACMRELNDTGWLAYKGRKTCAAFLALDLWIDWRIGAFHFEEVLLDYDVAMNYGNWLVCVGLEKDYGGQSFRDRNHEKLKSKIQSEAANDPDGTYIRQWVPELRKVPAKYINTPWMMSLHQLQEAGVELGTHYPLPVISVNKLQFLAGEIGVEMG
eukprot:gnl/TRDRNA2_/TRDRNA2_200397_c0_seq1.p1 gnl/TRDRNA2_/TRDRNA2_200397_c0~~gnl/TRDRNA2_/TRDRNA2_200397_c0_seq1.p1  ORF type:complete len:582 (+),score=87.20 gnl/TRDRNA2_/TRDRNA2_200397_c0_seq1:88-1833(+)